MPTHLTLVIALLAAASASADPAAPPPAQAPSTATAAALPTLSLAVPNAVIGGDWLKVELSLSEPAARDLLVALISDNPNAPVNGRVIVSRGRHDMRFAVHTKAVPEPQTATISASLGSSAQRATVTISPRPAAAAKEPSAFHGVLSPDGAGFMVTIGGRTTLTGPDGSFTIHGLPSGPAQVNVSGHGFEGSAVIEVEN